MKTFQHAMLVIHRYLGFVLSLLFVAWFLSGFVMMYERYPTMRFYQRLQQLPITQVLGKPYYLAYQDDHHSRLLAADNLAGKPFTSFPTEPLLAKLKSFNPENKVVDSRILTVYDDYYYSRNYEKRLPVLRVKVDTPEQSWYYVDLKTGQIVLKHENGSRFQRWIYHGLHSLDFGFLVYKRPLWDIVVWVLMLGGTAVSVTGLILTWKWIRRKGKKLGKKARKRNTSPTNRRSITILDPNPHEQP